MDSCITYPFSTDNSQQVYDDPHDLIQHIVSKTHLLGVYAHPEKNVHVQFGIGETLRAPEFSDRERAQAFGDFVDAVQDMSDLYHSVLAEEHKPYVIFIERENPIPEAQTLSVIVSQSDDDGIVFVAGPSRMDYERVLRVLMSR